MPKPSRDLGIHLIDVAIGSNGSFTLGYFDGESFDIRVNEVGLPKKVQAWIRDKLTRMLDEDGILITAADLKEFLFSRSATIMLNTLINEGRLINPFRKLKNILKVNFIPADDEAFQPFSAGNY